MKNALIKIFKKDKNIIIGAIHFAPLLGYPDYPGFEITLESALKDLAAFEEGGVDGVIIENNYDVPHKINVDKNTVDIMVKLGKEIRNKTNLPIGVNVLWNDFKSALFIARAIEAQFIRIPVFVDKVETDYGVIEGNPKEVINYRKEIKATDVAIFTDIHVKHAKLLNNKTIQESAIEAAREGSDALIVTGKWTGDAPEINDLQKTKKAVGDFPILVGSGTNEDNIKDLFAYANGAIVSTSLKEGSKISSEVNVKKYDQRIDINKVKKIVSIIK